MQRIFLVGFMGSGKSTIGRLLANDLGYAFLDADDYIEKKMDLSISRIFEIFGEDYFRNIEREVIQDFKEMDEIVIATGGGMPCFFDNMEQLNQAGETIFLDVSASQLTKRLCKKSEREKRPLLKEKCENGIKMWLTIKLLERYPFYQEAKMNIDANGSPFEIVEDIRTSWG